MQPNTIYEWRVRKDCGSSYTDYCEIQTFTTWATSIDEIADNSTTTFSILNHQNQYWINCENIDFQPSVLQIFDIKGQLHHELFIEKNFFINHEKMPIDWQKNADGNGIYIAVLKNEKGQQIACKF